MLERFLVKWCAFEKEHPYIYWFGAFGIIVGLIVVVEMFGMW